MLCSPRRDRSNATASRSRKVSKDATTSSSSRSQERRTTAAMTSSIMTSSSRSPSPPVMKSKRSQSLDIDVLPSVRYNDTSIPSIKEEDVYTGPYQIRPRTHSMPQTSPDKTPGLYSIFFWLFCFLCYNYVPKCINFRAA